MYELILATIPPLQFAGADIAEVGEANASINGGDLPGLPVTIDNARGDLTRTLATTHLLRARAELRLYGTPIFTGAVQAVTLGPAVVIELEA